MSCQLQWQTTQQVGCVLKILNQLLHEPTRRGAVDATMIASQSKLPGVDSPKQNLEIPLPANRRTAHERNRLMICVQ